MAEPFIFQTPSFLSGLIDLFVWVIFILSLIFFISSFFIIQYHLSHYSLHKKSALWGEMVYTVVAFILLLIMGITSFTITLS